MYEGNNPTALHSREWLVDSLLSLMEDNPYSRITVRDICNKADLSRQTFYNFLRVRTISSVSAFISVILK